MNLTWQPFVLEFKHPFGVSSNTRKSTPTVFIRIEANGKTGYGEACLPGYLGETVDGTISFFEKVKPFLQSKNWPVNIADLLSELDTLSPANNPAKAAVDIALNDLAGKFAGKPFYELLNIGKSVPMSTSFTIGIDSEEKIEQKINEALAFDILKIKAGTPDDKKLIETLRRYTGKPLYIDVNEGWTDKQYVLEMVNWMHEQQVILLEQPMPVAMKDEMAWVSKQSPIPIVADESVKRFKDLEELAGVFTGINIKLMKCTGLNEAIKMIDFAKKHDLKILLGCMAESSCATSAMAQLMRFADYIDLDAPNLYKNDPFRGIIYEGGKVVLNDLPGIGAEPIVSLFNT